MLVPTCWPKATARSEKEIRAGLENMVGVRGEGCSWTDTDSRSKECQFLYSKIGGKCPVERHRVK